MTLPDPLTPPDCDMQGLHYMPLDCVRLVDSDFALTATAEEFRAGVLLWCKAWTQVPAASLPNDDRKLAKLAQVSPDEWERVRAVALSNFILCADGRLYHPVIAEKANAAHSKRRTLSANARRRWHPQGEAEGREELPEEIPAEIKPAAKPKAGAVSKTNRRTLPEDWKARDEERALALGECKMTQAEFEDAEADFREWAGKNGRRIKDGSSPNWNLAFRNHLRAYAKRIGSSYRRETPARFVPKPAPQPAESFKAPEGPAWFQTFAKELAAHDGAAWRSYGAQCKPGKHFGDYAEVWAASSIARERLATILEAMESRMALPIVPRWEPGVAR